MVKMELLPQLFKVILRSLLLYFLAVSLPIYALEFCDLADLQDDFNKLTARDKRVGPPDLFQARVCDAWQWWVTNGPDAELERPEADFLTMIFSQTRSFKEGVTSQMKKLWDKGGSKDVININEAVPSGKQNSQTLHAATLKAMEEGASLIVRPFLMTDTRVAHPDFLIKVKARAPPDKPVVWVPESSDLRFLKQIVGEGAKFDGDEKPRDYYYLPVIIKSGSPKVRNIAFDPKDLSARPDLRLDVKSDYSVLMLHTLAVLQEIQFGMEPPEKRMPSEGKMARAEMRLYQPQGLFVLRNRGQLDPKADDYMTFGYFSMDVVGGDEGRLNRSFDPSHQAHFDSYLNAARAKTAAEVAPHYSSTCKTCPLKEQHVPEMVAKKDVSLIYLLNRPTVAHFKRTEASHGKLDTWEQIARLDPKEAINLFPTLDGISQERVIPELFRIIRQARSLKDNAAIDNSPPTNAVVPEGLIKALNAIGLWSFQQLLDLESKGEYDNLSEMVAISKFDSDEDFRSAKKSMGGKKGAISRKVKAATGKRFGEIWEHEHLLQDLAWADPKYHGILSEFVAMAKVENDYPDAYKDVYQQMQDLLAWAHSIKNYKYFDVLTISATDRHKYNAKLGIYFDIEGDPELRPAEAPWMKTEYAWGLRIVDLETGKRVSEEVLVLEDFSLKGMEKLWERFIALMRKHGDSRIYYFSDYESEVIGRFLRVFGPDIPRNKKLFTKKGIDYFESLPDYQKFTRTWGRRYQSPDEFEPQRAVLEYIIRHTPELPEVTTGMLKRGARKTYEELAEHVALSRELRSRMVDFRKEMKHAYTMPILGYDLKTIAKTYGFEWRDPDSSALQSIVWFRRYVELMETDPTHAQAFLDKIMIYNVDDVRATEALHVMLKVRFAKDYAKHLSDSRRNRGVGFLERELKKQVKAYNKRMSK
jgi:hypothetical protein